MLTVKESKIKETGRVEDESKLIKDYIQFYSPRMMLKTDSLGQSGLELGNALNEKL